MKQKKNERFRLYYCGYTKEAFDTRTEPTTQMEESFYWIFLYMEKQTPTNPGNPLGRKYKQLQLH